MRYWVISGCVLAMAGIVGATAPAQAADAVKSQPTELLTAPLTGDASREVKILSVLLPVGADSGRHVHHGDQYTTVQEGEIHIDIDGKGDQVFKAGDVVHIDPMVVHRTQNLSGKPARTTELFIVAKGKPLSERADLATEGSSR
ncbi:MAG TPA: cupin domain-containing protein [Stellaceae bacterium]